MGSMALLRSESSPSLSSLTSSSPINRKKMAIKPSFTHSSTLSPAKGWCQKPRYCGPKTELARMSEMIVQMMSKTPLAFSESKNSRKELVSFW